MTKDTITASRPEVRKFGLLFTGVCAVIGAYLLYREIDAWKVLAGGSLFFLITGLAGYPVLRPIYIGWMKFAFVLGWVNTRLILGIFFFLVLTPIGLLLRLMGKDLLDQRIDRTASTYWKKRPVAPYDRTRVQRLF